METVFSACALCWCYSASLSYLVGNTTPALLHHDQFHKPYFVFMALASVDCK